MNTHLGRRGLVVLAVAIAAYSWVAAGLRPFTLGEGVLVAIPALLVLVVATRKSETTPMDTAHSSRGSVAVWLGLVVLATVWELSALFSSPRSAHPTLSVIADDVMSVRPGRALVFVLWLALGWVLVRGSRTASS